MSWNIGIENLRNLLWEFFGGGKFKVAAVPAVIPAGEIWHICSGDCWSVNGVEIQAGAELRVDGELHSWGDVTGTGAMTGEGDLRLH
ncbi:hypothetical protein ES703_43017 [subsurface metagenome]